MGDGTAKTRVNSFVINLNNLYIDDTSNLTYAGSSDSLISSTRKIMASHSKLKSTCRNHMVVIFKRSQNVTPYLYTNCDLVGFRRYRELMCIKVSV